MNIGPLEVSGLVTNIVRPPIKYQWTAGIILQGSTHDMRSIGPSVLSECNANNAISPINVYWTTFYV